MVSSSRGPRCDPWQDGRDREHRLVVFADPGQAAPAVLLPAVVEAAAAWPGLSIAAIFLTRPPAGWIDRKLTHLRRRSQRLLGSGRVDMAAVVLAGDALAGVTASGLPIRVLADGDPNAPSVIAALRQEFTATLALNLYCMRRFEPPLLSCFSRVVNYHNGRLPQQRGLRASNWSLYLGEPRSGFAFHVMEPAFDSGAILLDGEVDVLGDDAPADLEVRKARAAAARLPELLRSMADGDAGCAQSGSASYRSAGDWRRLCRVADPESLTTDDWQRRLRAFLRVETKLPEGPVGITGVAVEDRPRGRGFRSADGQWLRVTSIEFWPPWLQRLRGARRPAAGAT